MTQQLRDFAAALAELPAKHRAWLEDGDVELFAYYGWGVMLNSAQLAHIHDVQTWPPGTAHVWRWANRTGKTTGLDLLYAWAAWYKWRFEAALFDDWLRYNYKVLHASPLSELAGKAWELFGALIEGRADQQRNPITHLYRPALLRAFYTATKIVDVNDVDRPVVNLANGSQIDFRSTQGKAARLESDQWWLIGWDEFPRQQPADDIPVIFDQTMLPRSSDFMAPVILAGTATIESEYIYTELEEIAAESRDWNFTQAARSANFAATKESQDRQRRMSIDKDVAARSLDGVGGGVSSTMFPEFLLKNAFRVDLPERIEPPAADDEEAWLRRKRFGRAFLTSFDHALAHDDNVYLDIDGPWPPHLATPEDPFVGAALTLVKGSRTLTPDEQQAYLSRDVRAYRSKVAVIDSTGPGGLSVYRSALQDGLPVVDCNLQARAAKWVTNKEYALQALQRMFAYGLPFEPPTTGFIDEWPAVPEGLVYGLFRFPNSGPWLKMRRQLAVYKRQDEKLRQDAAMTLTQLAWYLWKFLAHADAKGKKGPTSFNIVSTRARGRRFAGARR
jgi:hypothetical protein